MIRQLLLISLLLPIISCASLSDKSYRQSLIGKWKLIGVECDIQGKNCRKPIKEMLMEFTEDGLILSDNKKFGHYTLTGNSFIVKENNSSRSSTVEIIRINEYILITREKRHKNTEKLIRAD